MTIIDGASGLAVPKLMPALRISYAPRFPGATWIGLADDPPAAGKLRLASVGGFDKARLLVRSAGLPVGFAEVAVDDDGCVSAADVWAQLPTPRHDSPIGADDQLPPITVVICTRDRCGMLATALNSVLHQDYPEFDVVVVDNGPTSGVTRRYVAGLGSDRVRVVHEPAPGLSRARNAAVRAAGHQVIAFTDDDVVADSAWLRAIGSAFLDHPDTACVTGLVPTGELTAATHAYFDRRVGWARNISARRYSLADPPPEVPLFPYQVGLYGTGANFAINRDVVVALGGFNEILGAGAPAKGGEDLDMFFRVVRSGRTLAYAPSAIVWHRHRDDVAGLVDQSHGYGLGLGAWLTANLLLSPASWKLAARTAVRNAGAFVRLARAAGQSATPSGDLVAGVIPPNIGRIEMTAILAGPAAYLRGWREGRVARPFAMQGRDR